MPNPISIGITVYGKGNPVEGASVNIGNNSGTTDADGQVVINAVGNAGDFISIVSYKEGVGRKTQSLTLTGSPQQVTVNLEQTSDMDYYEADAVNRYLFRMVQIRDYEGNFINLTNPLPVAEDSPKDIRYDANDALPNYIGLNYNSPDADTSSKDWTIFKYTYSGSDATRIQIRKNVAWDDRSGLF